MCWSQGGGGGVYGPLLMINVVTMSLFLFKTPPPPRRFSYHVSCYPLLDGGVGWIAITPVPLYWMLNLYYRCDQTLTNIIHTALLWQKEASDKSEISCK